MYQRGEHKAYLASLGVVEDHYLRGFSESKDVEFAGPAEAPAGAAASTEKMVMAETASWRSLLKLDPDSGQVVHCGHGSSGKHVELGDYLIVQWTQWPAEVFMRQGDVYRKVHAVPDGQALQQSLA